MFSRLSAIGHRRPADAQRSLVSIQIALCLAALVAAGLLGRTLGNLKWAEIGFDRENLAYASVSPVRAGYTAERIGPLRRSSARRAGRLPGIVRVSTVSTRLLSGGGNNGRVNLPGRPWMTRAGRTLIQSERDSSRRCAFQLSPEGDRTTRYPSYR